jgi:hypothetical protein
MVGILGFAMFRFRIEHFFPIHNQAVKGVPVPFATGAEGVEIFGLCRRPEMLCQMKTKRMVIYSHDVQRMTGRSLRYAQEFLQEIKRKLGKEKNQLVTTAEYCKYAGMSREEVEGYL